MHERLSLLLQRMNQPAPNDLEASGDTPSAFWSNPSAPLIVIAALAVATGLVLGLVGGALWNLANLPAPAGLIALDSASQDDYIISVAEAYFLDQDLRLAHDRLARLNSAEVDRRVQTLATGYAGQHDVIAGRLAGLAVALGSQNPVLVELYLEGQAARIAELSQDLGGVALLPPEQAPLSLPITPGPTGTSLAPRSKTAPSPTPRPPTAPGSVAMGKPTDAPPSASSDLRILNSDLPQSDSPDPGILIPDSPQTRIPRRPSPAASLKPTVSVAGQVQAAPALPLKNLIVARLPVNVPDYVGAPSASISLTARPGRCTPAAQMPPVVDHTILLCSGQQYAPFRVVGENITIYGDHDGTAVVQAPPRGFGITATGNNIAIVGVHVAGATDTGDLNSWLCLYEACGYKGAPPHGALGYGGGILLDKATNSGVSGVVVGSGTIGIAVSRGANNRLVDNNLSELNGWGILALYTNGIYLVNNTTNNVNRACIAPDGSYLQNGCESAGIAAIQVSNSVFFKNHCERSGNCIYANGFGGLASNNNQFFNNYCAGASANCYEVTFAQGNRFDYNVATTDPKTGALCTYPFWVGGSIVKFGPHNDWNCKFTAQFSLSESKKSVSDPTNIEGF